MADAAGPAAGGPDASEAVATHAKPPPPPPSITSDGDAPLAATENAGTMSRDRTESSASTRSHRPHALPPSSPAKRPSPVPTPVLHTRSVYDSYVFDKVIGRGAFGTVYAGHSKATGERVAIKSILRRAASSKQQDIALNEISIMQEINTIRNPHLVRIWDAFQDKDYLHMVMEFCEGGELYDRVVQLRHFSEEAASQLMKKLTLGLQALHSRHIIHRDLKPENILFRSKEDDTDVVITDFGLSHRDGYKDLQATLQVGSPAYVPPEVLQLTPMYSAAGDMWSLGVILYVILSGVPPFYGRNDEEMFARIRSGSFFFFDQHWKGVSDAAKDLIKKLLVVDPHARLTTEQVLVHPWIASPQPEVHLEEAVTQLRKFNAKRKFRAAAMACVWGARLGAVGQVGSIVKHSSLRTAELDRIRAEFFAVAPHGGVDERQFGKVLSDLGFKDVPVHRLFTLFDTNRDNLVDFKELLVALSALHSRGEEGLKLCFDIYDVDGSGTISKQELQSVLSLMSEGPLSEEVQKAAVLAELFERLDTDRDDRISFVEFKEGIQRYPMLVDAFLRPVEQVLSPESSSVSTSGTSSSSISGAVATNRRVTTPMAPQAASPPSPPVAVKRKREPSSTDDAQNRAIEAEFVEPSADKGGACIML